MSFRFLDPLPFTLLHNDFQATTGTICYICPLHSLSVCHLMQEYTMRQNDDKMPKNKDDI